MLADYWQQALEVETYPHTLPGDQQEALRLRLLGNIQRQIRRAESQPGESGSPEIPGRHRLLRPIRPVYWQVAAAIVLLLTAGVVLFHTFYANKVIRYQTAYGERKEITLPDQSVVLLNGNSTICYRPGWGDAQTREVWLDGEAFFSVQHTVHHQKFVVHTPEDLNIEVLGTRFNVSNRRGKTQVVLEEGKVKVFDAAQDYVMQPGEMISYSARKPKLIAQKVNPQLHLSWKDNLLLFHSERIGSILERLAQSHGLQVEVRHESLPQELFTGSVPGDSAALILDKIKQIYRVNIRKEKEGYVIE